MEPPRRDSIPTAPGSARASWILGGSLLVLLVIIFFVVPEPSPDQRTIIRFLMATCAGLLSFFFIGGVVMHGSIQGRRISASGGFVLFLLIQFVVDPFAARTLIGDAGLGVIPVSRTMDAAQRQLAQKGLLPRAEVTGRPNSPTREAVRGFQAERGLPVTGYLDRRTLTALGVSPQP